MKRFVIVGAGPVGQTTARALLDQGHAVDLVTRSGSGPDLSTLSKHSLDATDSAALAKLARGATQSGKPSGHHSPVRCSPLPNRAARHSSPCQTCMATDQPTNEWTPTRQ
jgi:NAD(P)-dependent dehydrogenase (short-subunit alcohol dehydrogenase family)